MRDLAPGGIGVDSFACVSGELTGRPEDIAGFAELWRSLSPGKEFAAMGSGTYRKMTRSIGEYIKDCLEQVLGRNHVRPEDVDCLVLSTSDACLARLGPDLAVDVLREAGMTRCVPAVLSMQQCCSSLAALRYGWELFADDDVRNVVVMGLDFTLEDSERVKTFAVFGDAVAGCLISREPADGSLELLSSALTVDYSGLIGADSFASRQQAARSALDKVFGRTGEQLQKVTKVFGPNLYPPVTLFNAAAAGVPRQRLHAGPATAAYGHCGNADWMVNLIDYEASVGIAAGALYLALSTAPGFFACGLLRGR